MAAVPEAIAAAPATFERGGWHFEAAVRPLWGSDRIDELAREQKLCKVPDMFCGDAALRVHHPASGMLVELSALDALRCCRWRPPAPAPLQPPRSNGGEEDGPLFGTVRCQFADQWRPHGANPDVRELEVTSDWTCSTPYWGSVYHTVPEEGGLRRSLLHGAEQETAEELPMELLRQRDEIHWYQEVLFWEDELADNGLCRAIVRVRVMPTFWFALLVCEMRVDNVLLREVATRLFCRFDSEHILREWTWKEATYEALRSRGVELTDNPHISQTSIGTTLLGPEDVQRQLRHTIPLGARPGAGEARDGETREAEASQSPD